MSTPGLNASIVAPRNPPSNLPKSTKQLSVFVTLQIVPSKIEQWKQACRPVWDKCAQEPECLFFDVFQDSEKEGRFRFVEIWSQDRRWFLEEQIAKPYYTTMNELTKDLITEKNIEFFERDGEGSVYSEEYLEGGKRMEKKTQIVI